MSGEVENIYLVPFSMNFGRALELYLRLWRKFPTVRATIGTGEIYPEGHPIPEGEVRVVLEVPGRSVKDGMYAFLSEFSKELNSEPTRRGKEQ